MKGSKLMTPTVHRNGTSRDALLDGYTAAAAAVRKAIEAVSAAYPNGRDYYPQGELALRMATEDHEDRLARLKSVLAELGELAEAVADA